MYSKKEIENLYETDINEICRILLDGGYPAEHLMTFINTMPKEYVVQEVLKVQLLNNDVNEEIKNAYIIPEKYKKAENDYLQDDRDNIYNTMNKTIDNKTGKTLEMLYE